MFSHDDRISFDNVKIEDTLIPEYYYPEEWQFSNDFNSGFDGWNIKKGEWENVNSDADSDTELHFKKALLQERSHPDLNYVYKENVGENVYIKTKIIVPSLPQDYNLTGIFVHGVATGGKWALFIKGKNKLQLVEEKLETLGYTRSIVRDECEYNLNEGMAYWLKMKVIGTQVWGKAWKVGENEPGWMLQSNFEENTSAKTVGLYSYADEISFDDVEVTKIVNETSQTSYQVTNLVEGDYSWHVRGGNRAFKFPSLQQL